MDLGFNTEAYCVHSKRIEPSHFLSLNGRIVSIVP